MSAHFSYQQSLDVICQHKKDGTIIPLKIRLQDEDGEKNNNFNSNILQDLNDLKSSPHKHLMLKKIKRPMSPSKSSIIRDVNLNTNENTDSIIN